MTCKYSDLDGSYVLGSLAPAERADYERHLTTCQECARAVRELAGLPGLLARVPAAVLESPTTRQPVPETLLPALVAATRKDQRRRTTRAALLAAAAVAVAAGGTAATVAALDGDGDRVAAPPASSPTTPTAAPPELMTPVGSSRSTGWVSLTEVDGGTRVDLTCVYRSHYPGTEASTYKLVVLTTEGRETSTFPARPGREVRAGILTAVRPEDITAVEVRNSYGDVILRLAR